TIRAPKQLPHVAIERDGVARARQLRRGLVAVRSERRDAGSRRRIADPPPARHGHVRRRSRARLRIFARQPRTLLEIRDKCRTPYETRAAGAPHRPGPRRLRAPAGVRNHKAAPGGFSPPGGPFAALWHPLPGKTAIPFAVALRPAEDFAEPRSHSFRMVRRH